MSDEPHLAAGCGTGLLFLNNIAQLVSALGGSGTPAVYVSVFSVSSCAARLLLGCALSQCTQFHVQVAVLNLHAALHVCKSSSCSQTSQSICASLHPGRLCAAMP